MTRHIFNIFPTTIYVSEIFNHKKYKDAFYKVYPKYDYEQVTYEDGEEWVNTTSENTGNPFIHLDDELEELFENIISETKIYIHDVLKYKDIFDFIITKSWISRSRAADENIPWHKHSTSHISFSYYLNTPPNSHVLKFANANNLNGLFDGLNTSDIKDGVRESNELNASSFHINPEEGTLILFPSAMEHCTASHSNDFKGERLAIVGDITLVYKEDGDNDYSMGFVNPKYWRTYK